MQTLNVGAGQTDEEYKHAEEQRREDLRDEARTDANFFFGAAILAALGTGLLPIRLNIFVSIGAIDLLAYYGRPLGALFPDALQFVVAAWVAILVGLGFAARKGYRWAFLLGIGLYGADMIALLVTFSFWSFAVHGIFLFKWFQGQTALKELNQAHIQAT